MMTCARCPSDVATRGCLHCGEIGQSTERTGDDAWRTTYRWCFPPIADNWLTRRLGLVGEDSPVIHLTPPDKNEP